MNGVPIIDAIQILPAFVLKQSLRGQIRCIALSALFVLSYINDLLKNDFVNILFVFDLRRNQDKANNS